MHMLGEPRTMQDAPQYENVVEEVGTFLAARMRACRDAGIDAARMAIDPGFGFGKQLVHNLAPEPPPPGAQLASVSPPRAPRAPEYELFDHVADPLNTKNVADEHPEVVKELAAELERWREMATSKKLPSDADTAASASPEELERLRALGYL